MGFSSALVAFARGTQPRSLKSGKDIRSVNGVWDIHQMTQQNEPKIMYPADASRIPTASVVAKTKERAIAAKASAKLAKQYYKSLAEIHRANDDIQKSWQSGLQATLKSSQGVIQGQEKLAETGFDYALQAGTAEQGRLDWDAQRQRIGIAVRGS